MNTAVRTEAEAFFCAFLSPRLAGRMATDFKNCRNKANPSLGQGVGPAMKQTDRLRPEGSPIGVRNPIAKSLSERYARSDRLGRNRARGLAPSVASRLVDGSMGRC